MEGGAGSVCVVFTPVWLPTVPLQECQLFIFRRAGHHSLSSLRSHPGETRKLWIEHGGKNSFVSLSYWDFYKSYNAVLSSTSVNPCHDWGLFRCDSISSNGPFCQSVSQSVMHISWLAVRAVSIVVNFELQSYTLRWFRVSIYQFIFRIYYILTASIELRVLLLQETSISQRDVTALSCCSPVLLGRCWSSTPPTSHPAGTNSTAVTSPGTASCSGERRRRRSRRWWCPCCPGVWGVAVECWEEAERGTSGRLSPGKTRDLQSFVSPHYCLISHQLALRLWRANNEIFLPSFFIMHSTVRAQCKFDVGRSEMSIATVWPDFYLFLIENDFTIEWLPFRRCSGYSSGEECKFSLLLDVVESEVWGGGLVSISHTCVHTTNIRQDCNQHREQVTLSVGIISNCKNLFYQTIFSKVPKYCK